MCMYATINHLLIMYFYQLHFITLTLYFSCLFFSIKWHWGYLCTLFCLSVIKPKIEITKRCGICVLWHILSLQASLSGLVNLADSASCRFFRICNLRSSLFFRCQLSLLFGSSDCCSHPPTPLGSLGLLFHESICSFIQGFLVSEQQFGLLTLTTVGAVFPAANCLSSHHQPRPGCQPIYSWWSLVLPE